MSQWNKDEDRDVSDDEDAVEADSDQYKSTRDAVLFAINISPSMLTAHNISEDDDEDGGNNEGGGGAQPSGKKKKKASKPVSAARVALQCAFQVLQQRIISNPNDMMGILLFGTEETKFPEGSSYKHMYMLLDLDVPDAPGIKQLKRLVEDEEEWNRICKPSSEKASMANVLFGANQIFTLKAPNFQTRRLFIVTDDDDPHTNDADLKRSAITRARDLYDLGIKIDPFYISNPGQKEFDPSKFFEDIVYRSGDADDDEAPLHLKPTNDGKLRLKEMVRNINSKTTSKRALFSNILEIAPGVKIGVKGYLLFKKQEPQRACWVYSRSEELHVAKLQTVRTGATTVREVEKTEIVKAYKFGGEQVVFTPEELVNIRKFGDPIIRIIGFKDRDTVPVDMNVRSATFIYPSETEYFGSTRTFTALWTSLKKKNKVGIAWQISRRNASPILVAMIPSDEEIKDGVQLAPPGIFLVQLPFADDVRNNPDMGEVLKAPNPLIDSMRKIVRQLYMPTGYNPDKYSNPALQWHYKILQAIALEEDLPETPEDHTVPKYRLIKKYASQQIADWAEVLEESTRNLGVLAIRDTPATGGRKRAADGGASGGPSAKAVKTEAVDLVELETDVRKHWEKGQLMKLTVKVLKDFLKVKRVEAGGMKKAECIEAVEEWFERKS